MADEPTREYPEEGGSPSDRLLRIGPFRLLERIGDGGMGIVFLAERERPFKQRVALKVIRTDRLDRIYRARFAMEQQALERMDHPNVARLLDAGEDEGQSWFAMEHVPGQPLGDYCREHRLSLEQRLHLFGQICDGVQHAHMKGILHRDLKPGNIMVHEVDGRPIAKIIDFGLAQPVDPLQIRATLHEAKRQIAGTLAYMSPEQADRQEGDLDTRTDVFSLGVVLYELITGELPLDVEAVEGLSIPAFGKWLRNYEPNKPSTCLSMLGPRLQSTAAERGLSPHRLRSVVRGDLDWVTMKALARDRQRRYPTVRELGREIQRYLAQRPVEAGPPTAWYVLRKWLRRHAGGVTVAAIALLIVAVFLAMFVSNARETARLERRTRMATQPLTAKGLLAQAETFGLAEEVLPQLDEWQCQMTALIDDAPSQHELLQRRPDELLREYVDRTLPALRTAAANVAELRADIEWVRQRMLAADAAWQACIADIEADDDYGIAKMQPQFGLIPLGRDPKSHLHEFEVLDARNRNDDNTIHVTRETDGAHAGELQLQHGSAVVLILIPGGTFLMGTDDSGHPCIDETTAGPERPQHSRTVAPFFLGKFEVTTTQHCDSDDEDPSSWNVKTFVKTQADSGAAGAFVDFARTGRFKTREMPVSSLTWVEANGRASRLGMRLPTEAEWEYGARARTTGPWSCDADEASLRRHANLRDASATNPVPVTMEGGIVFTNGDGLIPPCPIGLFEPNDFGLHDMHGNVREWCAGPLRDYDPSGQAERPSTEQKRVLRGGSAISAIQDSRSARRRDASMYALAEDYGYRFARNLVGYRSR